MAETLSGQPMDEVLASIRRIIADEKPVTAAVAPTPPAIDDDVLELGHEPARPAASEVDNGLLSDVSASASRHALAALSGVSIDPAAPVNSLDGLVRELLRPMLKAWLDANLPDLVETMVAREIARIGGR